jgi:hypothetical protein
MCLYSAIHDVQNKMDRAPVVKYSGPLDPNGLIQAYNMSGHITCYHPGTPIRDNLRPDYLIEGAQTTLKTAEMKPSKFGPLAISASLAISGCELLRKRYSALKQDESGHFSL